MLGSSTFRHGVHPPETKHLTEHVRVRRMPFPEEIILPLRQHAGRPATVLVKVGDHVERGDKVAEADGFVSVPIHASAAGTVKDIRLCPHPDGSHGRVRGHRGRSVLPPDPETPHRAPVGGSVSATGGGGGAEGRSGGSRGRRVPDSREAAASGGYAGAHADRQRGGVRALPHHRPPDDGRISRRGCSSGSGS